MPRVREVAAGANVELEGGITLAFTTPILQWVAPDAAAVNPGLRRLILEREAGQRGVAVSNVGGWQSPTDLLDWPAPEIGALRGWIVAALKRMTALAPALRNAPPGSRTFQAHAWANVNRDGHYNRLHVHPGSHWSGVYYVSTGQPDPSVPENGRIEFMDPRHIGAALAVPGFMFGQKIFIQPREGLLVMFPSWLEHWVTPFRGTGERISIAFNLQLGTGAAGPA